MQIVKLFKIIIIFLTLPSYAAESLHPPHPITTFGITAKVLNKTLINSHYKIIGTCTWADGFYFVETPAIEQFLPDFIVTVANLPDTNPWREAKLLFENKASQTLYQKAYKLATGSKLGFGDDSGQISSMHMNEERTRVVDVLGSPASLYQLPYLSHKPETRFAYPYYLSEADSVSDRTEVAEITYMATHPQLLINHNIGGQGHVWGHEIPRLMRITQPSRFRASVVAAHHAADIVTNKHPLHVVHGTSNSCGKNCTIANVIFDPSNTNIIWQEVYPKNRNVHFNSDDFGIEDDKAGNGNYVFVIWRKYRGCIQHTGKFIPALSFPIVTPPQKR